MHLSFSCLEVEQAFRGLVEQDVVKDLCHWEELHRVGEDDGHNQAHFDYVRSRLIIYIQH